MIAQAHRFHGRTSLRFVYGQGQTVRTPQATLKFVYNSRRKQYRAAVVVGKKTNKSAVVRNRIRRRIYEIIRQCDSDLIQPYDLVFTVFASDLADVEPEKLRKTIVGLLKKARVLGFPKENPGANGGGHAIVKTKETRE